MKQDSLVGSIDVSSRTKRQAATSLVIALVEKVYLAEKKDQESIPLILKAAMPMPLINTLDFLVKAICDLDDAFEHYNSNPI